MKIYLSDPRSGEERKPSYNLTLKPDRIAFDKEVRALAKEKGVSYGTASALIAGEGRAIYGSAPPILNVSDPKVRAALRDEALKRVDESRELDSRTGRVKAVSFSDAVSSVVTDYHLGRSIKGLNS